MVKKISVFFAPVLAVALAAQGSFGDDQCITDLQKKLTDTSSIQAEYLKLSSAGLRPKNGPVFLPGTNGRVVLLVHGFIASPFEVQTLGTKLNQQGYNVFMPLVPGFGSDGIVANRTTMVSWRHAHATHISKLLKCFSKISLVGFSLGGALVLDSLIDHYKMMGARMNEVFSSATLVSPYIQAKLQGAAAVTFFSRLDDDNLIPMDFLYQQTSNPDLKAILDHPEYYNQELPIDAAERVQRLGDDILRKTKGLRVQGFPVQLVYSKSDQTISWPAAQKTIQTVFQNPTIEEYEEHRKIPHQLLLRSANPIYIDSLMKKIGAFIDLHSGV